MLMEKERQLVVDYGKKLITSGLTKGTGGNISIYDPEQKLMVISPSGIDYFETTVEDIVVMDLEGNIVEGNRKPSVEYPMHSIFYKERTDVTSVVHTHATACATMAALRWDLPATNYIIALTGAPVVPCAKYATFATPQLAQSAFDGVGKGSAAFLANHGFIAAGPNLPMTFNIAEEVEFCADIYLRAKAVGEPVVIEEAKMNELFDMIKNYGQNKKK